MEREYFDKFIDDHIKELLEKEAEIYTIDAPEGFVTKDGKINIKEKLETLREMEKIYSVIEEKGENHGKIFEKYDKYLKYVRESIHIAEAEVKRIENENQSDLNNIIILLEKFRENRGSY